MTQANSIIGIPYHIFIALQQARWHMRSPIIWHKPHGMPDSAKDRPAAAHEYVFLMAKSERNFWTGHERNVWTVPPERYAGAHFAVMPLSLAARCILAASRPGDLVLDPFGGVG